MPQSISRTTEGGDPEENQARRLGDRSGDPDALRAVAQGGGECDLAEVVESSAVKGDFRDGQAAQRIARGDDFVAEGVRSGVDSAGETLIRISNWPSDKHKTPPILDC